MKVSHDPECVCKPGCWEQCRGHGYRQCWCLCPACKKDKGGALGVECHGCIDCGFHWFGDHLLEVSIGRSGRYE